MPDTTSTSTTIKDAAPAVDGWRPDLAALRATLDGIDDKIHDLLMERARVVEGVARSGKTAAFRPGREASMLRRLLARHTGKLPARTLVRMWREMLAGTTAMQAPVIVAVHDTSPSQTLALIAREHFGFLTPVHVHDGLEDALAMVRDGRAAVAVVPFPLTPASLDTLMSGTPRLFVIARLPYWARPDFVPAAEALVVATTPPDTSGIDRSLIVGPTGALTVCETVGPVKIVKSLIAADDPALPPGAHVLGGYAVPVAGDLA